MQLTIAAIVQLVLGAGLFWLGGWGRRSADSLVSMRIDADERRVRADGIARGGLFCQGIGILLAIFAVITAIAAINGVDPTLRPQ